MRPVADVRLLRRVPSLHHLDDGQVEAAGELPVALVAARHGHDRAGAVTAQHVVGHPDRNGLPIGRIARVAARRHAGLGLVQIGTCQVGLAQRLAGVRLDRGALRVGGDAGHERMLGRQHAIGRAEQRIGPRGEHVEKGIVAGQQAGVGPAQREADPGALAATDPVALHLLHAVRPVEPVEPHQQPLGIRGDAQHPLPHGLADHRVAAALALAVDHLLVGQHRAQRRAPVDRHLGHVGQPALVELEEDPLRPAIIVRVAGRDLAVPVVRKAQRPDLAAERVDVARGGVARVRAGLDRVLLGRQAERVPAHRMQDVEAAHPLVAGQNVRRGIAFRMPYVQPGRTGVGKHVEDVVFGLGAVDLGPESLVLQPVPLPLGLDVPGPVARPRGPRVGGGCG